MQDLLNRYYYILRSYLNSKCSYLIFFVTSECNARCKMCFYWQEIESAKERNILSLREIELISKNFKHLAYLSITGGEPTLRKDLGQIIYYFYKNSGTRFVTFSTNGLLPERTEDIVHSVLKVCHNIGLKVYISIDHIENKHDEIRGVKNCFSKALDTFSRLNNIKQSNNNLCLCIETVLSSFNKDDIFEIIDYVNTYLKPDAHSVSLARGNTRKKDAKAVELMQYKKVMDYMRSKSRRTKTFLNTLFELMMEVIFKTLRDSQMVLPCLAGRRMLTLTDDGFIIPCEVLSQISPERNIVMGDLRKASYDINAIANSRESRRLVNFIKTSRCYCTFECAALCNIVFNAKMYPKIFAKLFI